MKNILIIGLLVWPLSTAFAQITEIDLERKYEESLLDSAIRYELLKPVAFNLAKTNEQLRKANLAMLAERQFTSLLCEDEKTKLQEEIDIERRKNRRQKLITTGIAIAAALKIIVK